MPTIRWSDVDWIEAAGQVPFKDMLVSIRPEQIEHWKEDPDGRFAMSVTCQPSGVKTVELVKFYPSL